MGWQTAAGYRAARQTARPSCGCDDRAAPSWRFRAATVSLPACRQSGDNRQARCRDRLWLGQAARAHRMVDMGTGAHLFPDRLAQSPDRRIELAVDLYDRQSQRALDHAGSAAEALEHFLFMCLQINLVLVTSESFRCPAASGWLFVR